VFTYETRPDVRTLRFRDSRIPLNQRLKTITTGKQADGTARGTYTLNYASDDPMLPSRLNSIAYCAWQASDDKQTPACLKSLDFDWGDSGGYGWEESSDYALPTDLTGGGTQFVDLDGDGRVDFVVATDSWKVAPSLVPAQTGTWRNTGKGWVPADDSWNLPVPLAKADGTPLGTVLADFDGDGLPDLITDNNPSTGKPAVWLNRLRTGQGWKLQDSLSGDNMQLPDGWSNLNLLTDKVVDIDADGKADVVHFGIGCSSHPLTVLQPNQLTWSRKAEYSLDKASGWILCIWTLVDLNRDGLPDLKGISGNQNLLNTGNPTKGKDGSVWAETSMTNEDTTGLVATGDIDGDGQFDQVFLSWGTTSTKCPYQLVPSARVTFAAGMGWSTPIFGSYLATLENFYFWTCDSYDQSKSTGMLTEGLFQLADLNADGLADVVVEHQWGGQTLVNTGAAWKDLEGRTQYDKDHDPAESIAVPHAINSNKMVVTADRISYGAIQFFDRPAPPLSAYIDLDGDGVVDKIESAGYKGENGDQPFSVVKKAWLNKFKPPVIKGFPNGRAQDTSVSYAVITTADAQDPSHGIYSMSTLSPSILAAEVRYLSFPMRVVASTSMDDGVGSAGTTSYKYSDLRASSNHRGAQGFKQISVTDPTGIVTTTRYAQAWPYTGLPTDVDRRDNQGALIAKTHTVYCDRSLTSGELGVCRQDLGRPNNPGQSGVFVYPANVVDTSYLRDSSGAAPDDETEIRTTTTLYAYDKAGNPTSTTVTMSSNHTGEAYEKKIASEYGADGSDEQRFGKTTSTTVTTRQVATDGSTVGVMKTHRTEFKYRTDGTVALRMKKVEKPSVDEETGAQGWAVENESFYDYDIFGNVTFTTACASDFDHCAIDATNPEGSTAPDHPPFRTSKVSYDDSGRFPVAKTNAEGHTEYSTYDSLLGVLVDSTDANGVKTCYEYDRLGYQISQTDRCDSSQSITTSTTRYLVSSSTSGANPLAKTLTVTQSPTGSATATFGDALGRTIETAGRHFQGKLAHVKTVYDNLGRVRGVSKPFLTGESRIYWVETYYDWLGRVSTVTQYLFVPAGQTAPSSTTVITTYEGAKITTTQSVGGVNRSRVEQKNVQGKVSEVDDADGNPITYTYDPDGNLTDTVDPNGNNVHLEYDELGRKKSLRDPDLGFWQYGYNGFGDLVAQTDAKNKTTTMTYDRLGRMTSKTDERGSAEWRYDTAPGGKGKLHVMIGAPDPGLQGTCTVPNQTYPVTGQAVRTFSYTSFGQTSEVDECTDGEGFSTSYDYDDFGRQKSVIYPEANGSRLVAKYHYSSTGYLHYVADESDDHPKPYWAALEMNAGGQVTKERTRNGVQVVSTRDPSTGWLLGSTATTLANNDQTLEAWGYAYDEVGSLQHRKQSMSREVADWEETFTYDKLDRLRTATVKVLSQSGGGQSDSFDFDLLGNLTRKGGKTYSYEGCGNRPHAVCKVGDGATFGYDANGNMTSGNGHSVTYNAVNKAVQIADEASGATAGFMYGADEQRVVQSVGQKDSTDPSHVIESARTVYVGLGDTGKSIYERTTTGTTVEHVHFLYAGVAHGGNAFGVIVSSSKDSTVEVSAKYNLFDHLGSVVGTTDDNGQVIGPATGGAAATMLGYDAWGARRNPDGTAATAAFNLLPGHREYTGHEAIPGVGLVNMNGRVYDPQLGRFLSPDPTLQVPTDLQNYNRYSYTRNNPLRYTDPMGYSFLTSLDFWSGVIQIGMGAIACTGGPAMCYAGAAALMAMNSTVMVMSGASWDQVVMMDMFSVAAGFLGGGIGQQVGGAISSAGKDAAARAIGAVIGGAIAGAVSAGIHTAVFGGDLGESMLTGAAAGAFSGALTVALSKEPPVSQQAEVKQQGGARLESGGTSAGKAGAAWNWAKGDVDALFNDDYTGFSDEFVRRMQPVFDKQGLNVDLSQVSFEFGGPTNFTEGYDITLQGGELARGFNDVLGDTLHETGHVVQFANAPGATLDARVDWVESLAGQQYGDATRMYGDEMARYRQDPYLANQSLGGLGQSHLLSPSFTLEAQADRFRDVLMTSSGWGR
jgi:RHS repeat-associated protein